MKRRPIILAATTALVAATAALVLIPHGADRREASPPPTASTGTAPRLVRHGATVTEARYRLSYEQYVTPPGREPVTVLTQGTWITTPTVDGHTAVRYLADAVDGPPGMVPTEAAASATFELAATDGALTAIGFADDTSLATRRLMTGLATTFQLSTRAGTAWTASEEDLTGRYDAAYTRRAAAIERTRPRYTALRGDEVSAAAVGGVIPHEQSRFVIDADGLVSAEVALDVRFELQPGTPAAVMELHASLQRIEVARVPAAQLALAMAPIEGHADLTAARREIDDRLVGGASLDQLLAALTEVLAAGDHPSAQRGRLLTRLAALVRVDPSAASAIADAIAGTDDLVLVKVLAGALASTEVAAGTDALAGLLARRLDNGARPQVLATLSLADPVTEASVAALRRGLDEAGGDQALFGLATHQRKIASREPALAAAMVDELLARTARATPAQRAMYVSALGNAGSARALPVLRDAITTGDRDLGSAAVFSLRFVPGDEADALITGALERRELAFAAVRAIGFRDPARWRAVLAGLGRRYADNARIQGEIDAILQRWG